MRELPSVPSRCSRALASLVVDNRGAPAPASSAERSLRRIQSIVRLRRSLSTLQRQFFETAHHNAGTARGARPPVRAQRLNRPSYQESLPASPVPRFTRARGGRRTASRFEDAMEAGGDAPAYSGSPESLVISTPWEQARALRSRCCRWSAGEFAEHPMPRIACRTPIGWSKRFEAGARTAVAPPP